MKWLSLALFLSVLCITITWYNFKMPHYQLMLVDNGISAWKINTVTGEVQYCEANSYSISCIKHENKQLSKDACTFLEKYKLIKKTIPIAQNLNIHDCLTSTKFIFV